MRWEVRSPSRMLPSVPTFAETGIGFPIKVWGLFAPAGTPDAIVSRLNGDRAPFRDPKPRADGQPVPELPQSIAFRHHQTAEAAADRGARATARPTPRPGRDDVESRRRSISRRSRPARRRSGQTMKLLIGCGASERTAASAWQLRTRHARTTALARGRGFIMRSRKRDRARLQRQGIPVGPGTSIYAPAGWRAHEWQVRERLQLLSIRGVTAGHRRMQFTVDRETKRSYIKLEDLVRMGGASFESHY